LIIIGDEEVGGKTLTIETKDGGEKGVSVEAFIERIKKDLK
jgi:threonyl-tRNA synthetase